MALAPMIEAAEEAEWQMASRNEPSPCGASEERRIPRSSPLFCGSNDSIHDTDCFNRVLSDRRFCGQHDGISPIEHGIGHIRRFGPCRARMVRHGLQHLRGRDHEADGGDWLRR